MSSFTLSGMLPADLLALVEDVFRRRKTMGKVSHGYYWLHRFISDIGIGWRL